MEALVRKGKTLAGLNEITASLSTLNQAIAIAPMDFTARFALGQVLEKFAYYEEALDAYRQADGLNPQSRSLLKRLIALCEELDEEDEANLYRIRLRKNRDQTGHK